jgi:NTP pyrophosphatase (non-canonical NTP hydrolase)
MSKSKPDEHPASLEALRDALRQFALDRDWDQFHSPKNLAIALSVEVAELLEHFQWISEADSAALTSDQHAKVREEAADVLLYLIRLADKLDIDLLVAATEKLALNGAKYPVEKARGSSKKYTEL